MHSRAASASSDSSAASLASVSSCTSASSAAPLSPSKAFANIPLLPSHTCVVELTHEARARIAVMHAFAQCPHKLIGAYSVKRVVGFGSNGVVLAATTRAATGKVNVAIKIIYKNQAALTASGIPTEIEIIKLLSTTENSDSSFLLKYVDDWQDARHFYLVTELFGSDWLATRATPPTQPLSPLSRQASPAQAPPAAQQLAPLKFKAIYENAAASITLPFTPGSSDLWAWAHAHRALVWESTGRRHSFLPLNPIKRLVKQIARALAHMHAHGFYHGDVKIENVLVQLDAAAPQPGSACTAGDRPRVRLADFGHARHVSCGIASYGTKDVSPPELLTDSPYFKSPANIDGRAADVFALGMVLHKLLHETGELPHVVMAARAGVISYEALLVEDMGFLPFDGLRDVDDAGMSLLDAMCMVDPMRRFTIDQVLSHPWLIE